MNELTTFESRLAERLRTDAEHVVRPFDASAITHLVVTATGGDRFGSVTRGFRQLLQDRQLRLVAVAVALLIVVIGVVALTKNLGINVAAPTPVVPSLVPSVAPLTSSPRSSTAPGLLPSPSAGKAGPGAFGDWRAASLPPVGAEFNSVVIDTAVAFNGNYIALASEQLHGDRLEGFPTLGDHVVTWTSTDGQAWAEAPDDGSLASTAMVDMAANDQLIVAVGSFADRSGVRPIVEVSSDGRTWMRYDAPKAFKTITALPGAFVAAAQPYQGPASIWTSADGQAWTKVATAADLSDGEGVVVRRLRTVSIDGQPVAVAVGAAQRGSSNLPRLWISRDAGASWSIVRLTLDDGNPDVTVYDAAQSGDGLLAVAFEGYCCRVATWTSADGVVWDGQSDALNSVGVPDVAIGTGAGYLLIGQDPRHDPLWFRAWTSTGAATSWTPIETPDSALAGPDVGAFILLRGPDDGVVVLASKRNSGGTTWEPLAWLVK